MVVQLPALAEKRRLAGLQLNIFEDASVRATQAELYFGLGKYAEAAEWLTGAREAAGEPTDRYASWEIQSTFSQLLGIARAQGVPPPQQHEPPAEWHPAWQALQALLRGSHRSARSPRMQAGSGSHYRGAAFGLRSSTSASWPGWPRPICCQGRSVVDRVGGSIVGAHYYLLKGLLVNTPDDRIDRQSYVTLVRRLHDQFLPGIERNLRTRTLTNLILNLEIIRLPDLLTESSSRRAMRRDALYARIADGHPADTRRQLQDLLVIPSGGDAVVQARVHHNWSRRAKVPALLLNATSLNSGPQLAVHGAIDGGAARAARVGSGCERSLPAAVVRPGTLAGASRISPRARRRRLGMRPGAVRSTGARRVVSRPNRSAGRRRRSRQPGHGRPHQRGLYPDFVQRCLRADGGDRETRRWGALGAVALQQHPHSRARGRVPRTCAHASTAARCRACCPSHQKKDSNPSRSTGSVARIGPCPPSRAYSTTDYGIDKDLQRKLAAIRTVSTPSPR